MKKTFPLSCMFFAATQLWAQSPILDLSLTAEVDESQAYAKNISFGSDGAYSNGEYDATLLSAFHDDFTLDKFSISLRFKAEYAQRMPVFVIDNSCRSAAFYLTDDGTIALYVNNSDVREVSEIKYKAGTWHTATMTYDGSNLKAYLDGVLAVNYSGGIALDCVEGLEISTTNFGNGDTFRGWWRDLKLYNQVINPQKGNPMPSPPNPNPNPMPSPPNPNPNPIPITGNWSDKITVSEIDLNPYYPTDISRFVGTCYYAGYADGSGHFVAWNARTNKDDLNYTEGIHITPLNSNLQRSGADIVIKKYFVEDILAVEKGYLTLLASEVKNNTFIAEYPNILSIIKIDMTGKMIFKTILAGDEGQGAQKHWVDYNPGETQFLFNGSHYGIWFEVKKNWAEREGEEDIHNGDKFLVVDKNGNILPDKTVFWDNSHSVSLQMVMNENGDFITGTACDAYPFGINIKNQAKNLKKRVWPPAPLCTPENIEKNNLTVGAGYLSSMLQKGDKTYVFLGALEKVPLESEDKLDPLMIILNDKNEVQKTQWLERNTAANENQPMAAHYGDDMLVVWYDSDKTEEWSFRYNAILAVLDSNGNIRKKAEQTQAVIGSTSKPFNFPNGDVGWIVTSMSDMSFKIVRVKK